MSEETDGAAENYVSNLGIRRPLNRISLDPNGLFLNQSQLMKEHASGIVTMLLESSRMEGIAIAGVLPMCDFPL